MERQMEQWLTYHVACLGFLNIYSRPQTDKSNMQESTPYPIVQSKLSKSIPEVGKDFPSNNNTGKLLRSHLTSRDYTFHTHITSWSVTSGRLIT